MSTFHDRVFIYPYFPERVLKRHSLSVAANNFCRNLISGEGFNKIYVYPSLFIDSSDELVYDNPCIECVLSKQLRKHPFTRKLAFIIENIKVARKIKSGSNVWFYNLPYTVILLFWLLRIFRPSIKLNLILLDYTPNQKGLKRYFNKFERFCFQRFDGMISLANIPGLSHKNSRCLPGVVADKQPYNEEITVFSNEFLISGALGENISLLSRLLEAFANIPEAALHITGNPPNKSAVEKMTSTHPNILFHGMIEYQEYLELLHKVPFLLSTRDPEMPENQCNFPSKIIEGLLHNRIIISTISYPQLKDIKYLMIEANDIERGIREIISMAKDELKPYSNQEDGVRKSFSTNVWYTTMTRIENNSTRHA